jgi:filamentous hemagglutinin
MLKFLKKFISQFLVVTLTFNPLFAYASEIPITIEVQPTPAIDSGAAVPEANSTANTTRLYSWSTPNEQLPITPDKTDQTYAPSVFRDEHDKQHVNIVENNKPDNTSHNKFIEYHVPRNGVDIHNNHADNVLFEVTGQNESYLKGLTTMVGRDANFILANPNGVTCNGCGFINTPIVKLTTETPTGEIKGGVITIGKGGLNATSSNVELNAGKINIHDIIRAGNLLTLSSNGTGSRDKQASIDASSMGAMSAGTIKIIATGEGVGVKSDGLMLAYAGNLNITADGNIVMQGDSLSNNGNTSLISKENIIKTGETSSTGKIDVVAEGSVNLSQKGQTENKLIADEEVSIKANSGSVYNQGALLSSAKAIEIQAKRDSGELPRFYSVLR